MEYGKLTVEYTLTKDETRQIEKALSSNDLTRRVTFRGQRVVLTDVRVDAFGHNVQFIIVKGAA